jgi:hypothetical protein
MFPVLCPRHHPVDHDVGQCVATFPPRPHTLRVILQLGVPLLRLHAVLSLAKKEKKY